MDYISRGISLNDDELVHICRALDGYASYLDAVLPEPDKASETDRENCRRVMEMDTLRLRLQGLLSGEMLGKLKKA